MLSESDEYFGLNNLRPDVADIDFENSCPILGCSEILDSVLYSRSDRPFCKRHGIRLHPGSRTFVYFNGDSREERAFAALRNVITGKKEFKEKILRSRYKAETHRIGFESSEDALSWNVFYSLYQNNSLAETVKFLIGEKPNSEPDLYLWGHKIDPNTDETEFFKPLTAAIEFYESDVAKFKTEPDIMLHIPNELLILIEAKFTSGNKLSKEIDNKEGEKPNSVIGTINKYMPRKNMAIFNLDDLPVEIYTQLYRNLIFANEMSDTESWSVINLVSSTQWANRDTGDYTDPTENVRLLLADNAASKFQFRTWENLYKNVVQEEVKSDNLDEYLRTKSLSCERAFDI